MSLCSGSRFASMYVKSLRDHGKLLAEGERPAEQASGDDVKSVYENVRSSKTGMSDKVPGKPAAATAQETGDEAVSAKTWHDDSLTLLLEQTTVACDSLADFVLENALCKAPDAVEALVASQGGCKVAHPGSQSSTKTPPTRRFSSMPKRPCWAEHIVDARSGSCSDMGDCSVLNGR